MKNSNRSFVLTLALGLLAAIISTEGQAAEKRFRNVGVARKIFGDNQVWISYGKEPAKGEDYERALELETGEVVSFVGHAAIKMKNDGDLQFGDVVVKAHNVSPDYPGVYGLWIKKTEAGYDLVFNTQADTWGTMYDPDYDVCSVPLAYEEIEKPSKSFTVKVEKLEEDSENGPNDGIMVIEWGPHRLSAKFDAQ